ncbi:PREDICTED: uncharacterized protein At2g34160-like [Tarenaya hassleriana]|uniref:uncharacterized protein At2g34160-like n=1 Tax=Tarenaya hassleriana TaxID=28532 RepID=UPI00053C1821|nr:PREDICTED: uncharacterized protein At2g34160-like [Tarenaya hassleriana]
MEKAKDGSENMNNNNNKNRIQVSNMKRPLFFYVNLAKRQMQQRNEVELSGLGLAVAKVVTIVEILKSKGFATEKKIMTSTVDMEQGMGARPIQKAKVTNAVHPKKTHNSV